MRKGGGAATCLCSKEGWWAHIGKGVVYVVGVTRILACIHTLSEDKKNENNRPNTRAVRMGEGKHP